jgi:hypothetical protein
MDWKATQYEMIVRETMRWHMTGDTLRLMNRLNVRNLPIQEKVWLEELSKETGLMFFTGHGTDGPVSGYRVYKMEEKVMEAYRLRKELATMQAELHDCQAELLQEKEYVRVLTELVHKLGQNGMGLNEVDTNEDCVKK